MPIPIQNLTADYSIQPLTLTQIQIYCPERHVLPDGTSSQFITCSSTGWTVPVLCSPPVIAVHSEDDHGVVLEVAHSMCYTFCPVRLSHESFSNTQILSTRTVFEYKI